MKQITITVDEASIVLSPEQFEELVSFMQASPDIKGFLWWDVSMTEARCRHLIRVSASDAPELP